MPSTVNGIGTWYYGKDRLVTRHDRCEFCGSHEELKSYDTTLYFVVVFIPVLPLGRRRIMDQCPRCRRHRAAKLGEWEKRKTEAILKATEAWQQDRTNSTKAIDALGTTIAFHDADSFRQIAVPVRQAFARDADVQAFLGDAYDHFKDAQVAEECYRAALMSRPDETSQEALAKFFLRQIRPADAEQLVAHILTNRVRAKAPLMLAVAEGYQAVGDHERAWRIVDEVGTTFPDLLSDPHYEKIRRSVSRNRGTNKIVRVADMDRARTGVVKETNWLHRHMGLAIVGSVLIAAALWYLVLAWSLGKHTVSLLNGTNAAYTVDINGSRFTLPPMSQTAADVREGTLKITVPDENAHVAPSTVEMHTDFFRRPWNRRQMVINPDRTAVMLWEETRYSSSSSDDDSEMTPRRIYVGETFYNLDKVDYVFQDFPSRIHLPNDKPVNKTRLTMAPDDMAAGGAISTYLPPGKRIEFLRKHLSDRPLRLQYHRLYQGLVEVDEPNYDLAAEYRALREKDPDDPVMTYLLARVIDDRDDAMVLFKQAADAPKPCAYAAYALAFDYINLGQFEEGLKRAQQADKLEPGTIPFIEVEMEALEGLGRIDEAIALLKGAEKHEMGDSGVIASQVRLLAEKHDLDGARKRIDDYCKALTIQISDTQAIQTHVRLPMEGVMHYAAGDMAAYRAAIAAQSSPDAAFASAVSEGKIDEAQSALTKIKPPTAGEHMILYVAARRFGRKDVADAAWTRALELYNKEGRDDRLFARAIAGSDPPSAKALHNWTAMPMDRCIMLTALGLRFPQKQSEFFADARKLHYAKRFPYHLIDEVLAGRSAP